MFGGQYVNTKKSEEILLWAPLTLTLSRFAGEGTSNPVLVAT